MIHINILDSYVSFHQVWIKIPQEIWSDHQKGKMVIFRVLTAQRQFLTIWPSQWQIKLTYRLKDSMKWSWHTHQAQKIPSTQGWQLNFPVNWSILTVHWKVKLWLFGQNQESRFIFHQNIPNHETCSPRNLKMQIRVWKWNFS